MKSQFCYHIPHVATLCVSSLDPLPTFHTEAARPTYVNGSVISVIETAPLSTGHRVYLILTRWIGAITETKMQQWAEEYAAQVEREAHELSRLDEMNHMGYAENHAV